MTWRESEILPPSTAPMRKLAYAAPVAVLMVLPDLKVAVSLGAEVEIEVAPAGERGVVIVERLILASPAHGVPALDVLHGVVEQVLGSRLGVALVIGVSGATE
jgi:hypothetical protein